MWRFPTFRSGWPRPSGVQARIEDLGRRGAAYAMAVQVMEEINTGIVRVVEEFGRLDGALSRFS